MFFVPTIWYYPIHMATFHSVLSFKRYSRWRHEYDADFVLSKKWGITMTGVYKIRERNGGNFPEILDIPTIREFREMPGLDDESNMDFLKRIRPFDSLVTIRMMILNAGYYHHSSFRNNILSKRTASIYFVSGELEHFLNLD